MSSLHQLVQRLPEPLRSDPGKTAIFAVLIVVLAVLLVRQFGGPTTVAVLASSIGGESDNAAAQAMTTADIARTGRISAIEDWLLRPVRPPARNLFRLSLENYPRVDSTRVELTPQTDPTTFWDRLAKSITSRADLRKQREIRVDNLRSKVVRLKLQSTMLNSRPPRAMIDGRLISRGEILVVDPRGMAVRMQLVQVRARSVVLETTFDDQTRRFELDMTGTARLLDQD